MISLKHFYITQCQTTEIYRLHRIVMLCMPQLRQLFLCRTENPRSSVRFVIEEPGKTCHTHHHQSMPRRKSYVTETDLLISVKLRGLRYALPVRSVAGTGG